MMVMEKQMNKQIRIDKYLADMGIGTRSTVKDYIRKGRISINGVTQKQTDLKIKVGQDMISFDGNTISYVNNEYFMLNKPSGIVSATTDSKSETVIDLIKSKKRKDMFPVGRLDKDTEGLLLITNDGDLAHKLLSPKKKVGKVYYAKIDGRIEDNFIELFKLGLKLEDGFITLPAELVVLLNDDLESEIELTIYEGKFHQVKRMFETVGRNVTYLKRISMGSLILDPTLKVGEYRHLTEKELSDLKGE